MLCDRVRGLARECEQTSGEDLVAAVTDVIMFLAVRVPVVAETMADSLAAFSRVTVH
mgnify:FL=1|jgi:hypothetical protein